MSVIHAFWTGIQRAQKGLRSQEEGGTSQTLIHEMLCIIQLLIFRVKVKLIYQTVALCNKVQTKQGDTLRSLLLLSKQTVFLTSHNYYPR